MVIFLNKERINGAIQNVFPSYAIFEITEIGKAGYLDVGVH